MVPYGQPQEPGVEMALMAQPLVHSAMVGSSVLPLLSWEQMPH